MTTYHVSQQAGNDSNDGLSPSSPRQFFGTTQPLMGAGDTMLLENRTPPNQHNINVGPNFPGQTYGTYGIGDKPIINHPGGAVRQAFLLDKPGTTLRGIHFTGPGFMTWITTDNITIEGCTFKSYGATISGVSDLAFGGRAIQMRGSNASIHHINIRDNFFDNTISHSSASDHIFLEHGNNITIEGNEFIEAGNNGGDHIHIYQHGMDNIFIQDNWFRANTSGKGHILCGGLTTDLIVRRNRFDGSNFVCGNESARYVEFYENDCFDVRGAGWSNDIRLGFAQSGRTSEFIVRDNKFIRCRNPLGLISEPPGLSGTIRIVFENNTIVNTQGTNHGWLKWTVGSQVQIQNSIVRKNLIVNSGAAVITATNQVNNVLTDNWFDGTPTTHTTSPKTGSSGLTAAFCPTTALAIPYGDRRCLATTAFKPAWARGSNELVA